MTVGTFVYRVVAPVEKTNLLTNPSFEIGSSGWAGTANINTAGSVVFGTAAEAQAFGAWSARLTGATGTFGIDTTFAMRSGTAYTASAYVRVTSATGAGGSVQLGGGVRVPVGSVWTRVTQGTTAGANANWSIRPYHSGAATGTLWVDGVQVEVGSVTTYVDGDQEGCQWLGLPHQSQSIRSGQTRAGGSVIPLAALGLRVETHVGVGMPPMVNMNLPRAILDGAEYQRTRADTREFVLTATVTGTTTPDLHQTRRRIIDALKIDRTFPPAPTRFIYTGAGEDVEIDAIYNGGLEITDMQVINDNVAARFVAFDPMWYSSLDEGTALAAHGSILLEPLAPSRSMGNVLARDPNGQWAPLRGIVGGLGDGIYNDGISSNDVFAINTQYPGTIVVGGNFPIVNGTTSRGIAYYAGGTWGTFGGVIGAGGTVFALNWSPDYGTLFIGGNFSAIGGTTVVGGMGLFRRANSTFGTLTSGTFRKVDTSVGTIFALSNAPNGALLIGGAFATVAGTIARGIVQWQGAGSFGTLIGGTLGTALGSDEVMVTDIAPLPNNAIAVVGDWGSTGGTSVVDSGVYNFIAQAWGTLTIPITDSLFRVAANQQSRLFVHGKPVGGKLATWILQPTREIIETVNTYPADTSPRSSVHVFSNNRVAVTGIDGLLVTDSTTLYPWSRYLGTLTFGYAVWNNYTWIAPDIMTLGANRRFVHAISEDAYGTQYFVGSFSDPGQLGTTGFVSAVVNASMADSYPVVKMRNTSSGTTVRLYQLVNNTTNDELYFNLEIAAGEEIIINMTPGRRSITSSFQGNVISSLLTGSNLATWRLIPGTNWLSFFANNRALQTNIYWRPRHWAIDGGAEPTI